jgi:hypothetical protein
MARDYILYEWRPSGRPFPPSRRPTFPPPRLKQGPYWVEITQDGVFRCTLRRGTWPYKRMLAEQAKLKRKQAERQDLALNITLPLLAAFVAFALARLLMSGD